MRNWNTINKFLFLSIGFSCTLPMRNWNRFHCYYRFLCFFTSVVVPYLWGIETSFSSSLSYLNRVVPYLWGIETLGFLFLFIVCFIGCTLPMRNWNMQKYTKLSGLFIAPLYLTYEELKQHVVWTNHSKYHCWLYLTYEELKHWNCPVNIEFLCIDLRVVPYLWGIETSFLVIIMTSFVCCTLPMRNWNEIVDSFKVVDAIKLYLTYEELKH